MKRLCVFAHWDKDNIIDDYVIYYLKALKEVCDSIIFVSDCDLTNEELKKINNLVEYSISKKHQEYDFGSYKRGYLLAKEKNIDFDELIFANDSCYGPFYPLLPIFKKMEKKNFDFWGLTQNSYGIIQRNDINYPTWSPHIQSYFLVLNKKVFSSKAFNNFIFSIKKEKSKDDIIKNYEIGLSNILKKENFKSGVYINRFKHTENCLASKWDKLILKYHYPFIKTNLIKYGDYFLGEIKNWDTVINSISNYPINYIQKNSQRYNTTYNSKYDNFNKYRKIRFMILRNLPMEFRYITIFIEKFLYQTLNTLCFNKLKKF